MTLMEDYLEKDYSLFYIYIEYIYRIYSRDTLIYVTLFYVNIKIYTKISI